MDYPIDQQRHHYQQQQQQQQQQRSSDNKTGPTSLVRAFSMPAGGTFGDERTSWSNSNGSNIISASNYRRIFPHHKNHYGHGPLIAPNTPLHAQAVMGNASSSTTTTNEYSAQQEEMGPESVSATRRSSSSTHSQDGQKQQQHPGESPSSESQMYKPPRSNLTALLESSASTSTSPPTQSRQQDNNNPSPGATSTTSSDEADSASGPPPPPPPPQPRQPAGLSKTPPAVLPSDMMIRPHQQQKSSSSLKYPSFQTKHHSFAETSSDSKVVRRCISSKELEAMAPPLGSPYAYMVQQKELIELRLAERLRKRRANLADVNNNNHPVEGVAGAGEDASGSAAATARRMANEVRNQRRAVHNQAVITDLCEIVTDLFMSENKLINPSRYGVDNAPSLEREKVYSSVQHFIEVLPPRYALGVDTPSEVLLHMRLMSVVRGDASRAVVHITNLGEDSNWTSSPMLDTKAPSRRLVTIACADAVGLLEYISKLLATGGSRVLDADVMLSSDNIVLDRFVVEMHGRLRLDKLSNYIEDFLQAKNEGGRAKASSSGSLGSSAGSSLAMTGSVYFRPAPSTPEMPTPQELRQEIEGAVSLTQALASRTSLSQGSLLLPPGSTGSFKPLDRYFSLPTDTKSKEAPSLPSSLSGPKGRPAGSLPNVTLQKRSTPEEHPDEVEQTDENTKKPVSMRERRPLVKRDGKSNLDDPAEYSPGGQSYEYMIMQDAAGGGVSNRIIPLIPFEELMLIETLGRGRVSTIYRAAWQRKGSHDTSYPYPEGIQMLALKVAMVDSATSDAAHINELRNEADIAARLHHPNICDLVGVAADSECFCLAYDYCEGGSLLSLLSDPKRYYEYLPIALDIANGMAYLHSRSVIHRDLKPSNILLTRDHRAKIADFGMSVANTGQELTAETGTYRYMAPEVIRHESYSSNADVYSFGICLWQLITREVPFATMTPIQAAYAVAEGHRPTIPASTPRHLREVIEACWDQDSRRRPSFTYVAMSLAEYAKISFSPANVGAQTLQIANDMLATVEGNSTVNVDFTTPVTTIGTPRRELLSEMTLSSSVGLEI